MHRNLRSIHRPAAVTVAVVALTLAAGGYPAGARPAATPGDTARAAPASCRVADAAALRDGSTETPDGHRSYEEWVAGPIGRQAVNRLWASLTTQFGTDTKTRNTVQLERGLIGVALEHSTRSLVVVVDPSRADVSTLQRRLAAVVQSTTTNSGPASPAPKVRVQTGCSTAAELLEAETVLARGDWHTRARSLPYAFHLDPADSTYHVTLHPDAKDVAEALRERLGPRVTVGWGMVTNLSRTVDGDPHYGGAGIGRNGAFSHCTSGFTVVRTNGQRGSVTAGHCFNNDDGVFSGNPVAGRWEYYGWAAGKDNYPAFDMMRIESLTETYANSIWVDPCCPNARTVTGRWTPVVGNYVCHSGFATRAKCGLYVKSLTAQKCNNDGCTPGLILFDRNGEDIGSPGDSGGPVYTRQDNGTAHINGMVVGAFCRFPSSPDWCEALYAEKISSIESHLGVVVATG